MYFRVYDILMLLGRVRQGREVRRRSAKPPMTIQLEEDAYYVALERGGYLR
jgi:hypothetical protein